MDIDNLLKENKSLREEINRAWTAVADSARDGAEYQATINNLRDEVTILKNRVLELGNNMTEEVN